jgi:hypothetical protein
MYVRHDEGRVVAPPGTRRCSTTTFELAALLACAGIFGCASSSGPPAERTTRVAISSTGASMGSARLHNDPGTATRTLPVPPDSVWQALPRVYEILGIPDAGAVAGQQIFGARNFRPRRIDGKRLSTFIDCGPGLTATPKADEYTITMNLTSRLSAAKDATTIMETMVEASGKPRATAADPVSCQSNGALEARIGELLLSMLVLGR